MRKTTNWILAACFATLSTITSPYYSNIRKLNLSSSKWNNFLFSSLFLKSFISTSSFVDAESSSPSSHSLHSLHSLPSSPNNLKPSSISYLDAQTSKEIDEKLMKTPGFSIDQLMELAGLSVAMAVKDYADSLPGDTSEANSGRKKKILVICGPGNNGGDGLVAARHLFHFGYEPTIVYPKRGKSSLFVNLVAQCTELNIPIQSEFPEYLDDYQVIVDAIFGFSFHGPAKPPFEDIIKRLASSHIPIISVDLPSGWHVEQGDIYRTQFTPAGIISLTAPKKCVEFYTGVHYLGGRFLPPKLAKEYGITLPSYPGTDQILRLSSTPPPQEMKSDWTLYLTEEGYPYYYNSITQQSHWAQFEFPQPHNNNDNDNLSIILSTASSLTEAKVIANHLVKNKLVACVNLIPSITSIYEWEGKVEESTEVQMIVKTRKSLIPEVTKEIKRLHSYSVPEVIAMDIKGGNQDYLNWVVSETKTKRNVETETEAGVDSGRDKNDL